VSEGVRAATVRQLPVGERRKTKEEGESGTGPETKQRRTCMIFTGETVGVTVGVPSTLVSWAERVDAGTCGA
jgi:hypothetical protein